MKKLLAFVLAMIVMLSLVGCSNKPVEEKNKPEEIIENAEVEENSDKEETETLYTIGSPAGTDIVEVVLEDYRVSTNYNVIFPNEGYSFVVLNFSIKNIGKTDLSFFPCADGVHESIEAGTIAYVDYNDGYIFYLDDVKTSDGTNYGTDWFIGDENKDIYLRDIKPLSPAVSYEVAILVPNEVVDNTDAPLLVKFNLLDSDNEKIIVSYKIR